MNAVGFFMAFGGLCCIGLVVLDKLFDLYRWVFPKPPFIGPVAEYEQATIWDGRECKIVWIIKGSAD